MYKNKRILAVIPARRGSKGLPGKNTLDFCGRPLIARTIVQALKSKYLDKVLVSTDDKKTAAIALKYGASVPFLRPKKLATSTSSIIDVLIHALDFINKSGEDYEMIMLLQATSPLRTTQDIDDAIKLFFTKNASSVISMCRSEHHPWWAISLNNDNRIERIPLAGTLHTNRQALPVYYRFNGAIYLTETRALRLKRTFIGKNTYAYLMPLKRSVDIDNRLDFEFARFLTERPNARDYSIKSYC